MQIPCILKQFRFRKRLFLASERVTLPISYDFGGAAKQKIIAEGIGNCQSFLLEAANLLWYAFRGIVGPAEVVAGATPSSVQNALRPSKNVSAAPCSLKDELMGGACAFILANEG